MANPTSPPEKNAQRYFQKAETGESLFKQIRKKERAADTAKTQKLRALRLAKEAADKDVADRAVEAGGTPPRKKAKRSAPQPKTATVRMIY